MSFAALKKNRENALSKLTEAAKNGGAKSYEDARFWEAQTDKTGNGSFVIRFLTQKDGEDLPWAKVFTRGFKGPSGKWYVENCLSTIGQDDPVGAYASKIWNLGGKENEDLARVYKRKLTYISNIMVISDPTNPANNGKVFLYKYGKKIHDKILSLMQPEFEDESPVNPFDFWTGADFKLKIRQVEGYRNYDKSEFVEPKAIASSDDEIEKIYASVYSLLEFTDPKNFKPYAELEAKMKAVLGDQAIAPETAEELATKVETAKPVGKVATAPEKEVAPAPAAGDEDSEDLEYFAKLAKS